ncbi:tripartite motif-containing protein 16-like [Erpetoichthys calabaricus]|uniref:Tripartite motif-containing protein 16-like n=1 Tax=Erpetoichthys calabaricus TaxID=27687 RepID=A0A8C4X9B2_ERPCA|nr:tripartite motif-containing protein 16-like [Erpetoichthys calabaricus]
MARATMAMLLDEFICSVCLETLNDPVSIPCGHNFCKNCIIGYWDQSQECSCPHCRKTFNPRPVLFKNTLLAEVIQKLKKTGTTTSSSQNWGRPDEVECDACSGKRIRAVKSCLTCQASYCEIHIQPHYEGTVWKDHKLIAPNRNLQEELCTKHHTNFEIYCRTDLTCICKLCVGLEHSDHDMVEPEKERAEKQKLLHSTQKEIQKRLQQRWKKLEEIRESVDLIKISADREVQETEKSFTDLTNSIEKTYRKISNRIRDQEKKELRKAERVMEQLQNEIEELKRRNSELTDLLGTDDHIHFLQTFSSVQVPPGDRDSLGIAVTTGFSTEDLRKGLSQLKEYLEKISQDDIVTFHLAVDDIPAGIPSSPTSPRRQEFLQYSCQLTLDLNTVQRELHLSERNRKVTCRKMRAWYPDHAERFDYWSQVLCRQALTGTCYYWEVEWSKWVVIGLTYKGIDRKGASATCRLGGNEKSWCLLCSHSCYFVCHNNKETEICAPLCRRIGVYLDYPAGTLSFYGISDTMVLLYQYNAFFTEQLYPGFWVGVDSTLVI